MSGQGQNIDPLGPIGLRAKFQTALQKGKLKAIRLTFTASGQQSEGLLPGKDGTWVPLTEAMASKLVSEETRPYEDEKKYLINRYEARVDEQAPAAMRQATNKAELDSAVESLPWEKMRAIKLSNKDFEMKYLRWERGQPVTRTAEQAEKLREERFATRGVIRGRGRGGRGRGSFRGAEKKPRQVPQAGEMAQ